MLAIKGIYDGKTVKPEVKIRTTKKYNVVITFLEEMKEPKEEYGIREFAAQHKAFDFWEDKGEDLYQDFLSKKEEMKTGDIVLVPYPFAELSNIKVRPALVISTTKDKYHDIVVSAITSVVHGRPGNFEILLHPNKINNLRAVSMIKVDRIVTLKKEDVIAVLGKLNLSELRLFKEKFRKLVD